MRGVKMRRVILLGLVVVLCLPLSVQAASIGGAETQGQGKFAIGLDQEFIFKRDLKKKTQSFSGTAAGVTLTGSYDVKPEIKNMYRTMVKASYGLLEGLDVYVKLGTADGEGRDSYSGTANWTVGGVRGQGTLSGNDKLKTGNAFAYGAGLKGAYALPGDWLIGADAQYLRHKHGYKATTSGTYVDPLIGRAAFEGSSKGKITFQEWQVAPYVAKKLGNFTPYLGVKYSDLMVENKSEAGKENYKADDNVGVFVGTDCKIGEHWKLNLEGRFIDETAMSLGAAYRF